MEPHQHRRKNIKAKRDGQRRSERERDPEYLDQVRALGYCSCARDPEIKTPCRWTYDGDGRRLLDADHMGWRPKGRKCSDRGLTAPMCWGHHHERTAGHGAFWGWSKERMRVWCVGKVERALELITAKEAA